MDSSTRFRLFPSYSPGGFQLTALAATLDHLRVRRLILAFQATYRSLTIPSALWSLINPSRPCTSILAQVWGAVKGFSQPPQSLPTDLGPDTGGPPGARSRRTKTAACRRPSIKQTTGPQVTCCILPSNLGSFLWSVSSKDSVPDRFRPALTGLLTRLGLPLRSLARPCAFPTLVRLTCVIAFICRFLRASLARPLSVLPHRGLQWFP